MGTWISSLSLSARRLVSAPALVVAVVLVGCLVCAGSVLAAPSEHPFEIVPGSFHFVTSSGRAGAHSDWTTSFEFAPAGGGATDNDAHEITVKLPAGFDASDTAVPTCTQSQLLEASPASQSGALPSCPVDTQIGDLTVEITTPGVGAHVETVPIYNMEVSSFGVAAELGYKTTVFTGLVQIKVRAEDLGLTATTLDIPPVGEVHKVSFLVWGVPAASEHDAMRGALCGINGEVPPVCRNEFGGPQKAGIVAKALLANPTSCEGAYESTMFANSWEEPIGEDIAQWPHAASVIAAMGECERIPFEPTIAASPSTRSAESPTGLDVSILVPQEWDNPLNNPVTSTSSYLKGAKVTLPEGMTANPGLAEGLGACTRQQYASETSSSLPGEGCPPEAKIGSITIETPLLAEPVKGAVYIATPYDNVPEFGTPEHPGGSLLALYIVAKEPQRGILIRSAGKIEPNPVTGQLVTTFERQPSIAGGAAQAGLPQQPFSRFALEFRPGATAPLISPPTCGSYGTQAVLTPWSENENGEIVSPPRSTASEPFQVTQGTGEGPCPSGGVPPFKPQVISGTDNNAGSTYSPFYLRILRQDGEQEITRFSTTLPPGLTGNLSGIPFCPDADIEASRGVSGQEEEERPSCPQASEIGHTIVSAGVGSVLAQTPGKVYLAGPYHGAPLSIVSITSAKVGPFDLGTVVIRFALDINPATAQVEVSGAQSEAIPRILKGVVVHVREIRVYMDRDDFIINPTSCNPMNITDTIDGAGADPTNPADQNPIPVNTPFDAADCSSLQFKPGFKVSTSGKTSRAAGASLSVKLTMPAALGTQANIKEVKVDLPKQLPSRLTTLQKACTAAQFNTNPAGCPAASVIGTAKAITPILPVPLEGPAYFVSHGGEAFPELEVVLQGYGFTIVLTGNTFISKTGITSSTFKTVPDQPVGSFELTLPEGKYSALAANGNLCTMTKTVTVNKKVTVKGPKGHKQTVTRKVKQTRPATLEMPTAFVGQNGAEIHQNTPISVTGCAKVKPAKKPAKHKKRGKKK
jgi:hypothetical protein